MARVRLKPPRVKQPWEREMKEIEESCRGYSDNSELLYLIHPGTSYDCDSEEVAKERIALELEQAVKKDQRVILVYPTDKGVYIDPAKITDIRGGYDEDKWIKSRDIIGINQATFVGGKLNKCLGGSYENFIDKAEQKRIEKIEVRLPLESIYTEYGNTAAQEFLAGIPSIGETESLCALLTAINDKKYYFGKSDFDYGFLNRGPNKTTKLHLNGNHVATIEEFDNLYGLPENTADLFYQEPTPLSIDLLVECDTDAQLTNKSLSEKMTNRWNKIQDNFTSCIYSTK